jgi:superfamily II DNA or RNA helicase
LIKQGKWEIKSPFTLASVATLGRRKHIWSELYNQFGTIICDEVQTVSAPNLFDFLLHCPACYLIGASATPRKDKNNFWLNSIFGPIVKRVPEIPGDTATSLAVQDVKIISTEFVYSCGRGEILDWNDLAKYLLSNEERNALIVRNVIEDWRAGRVILIVSKRLAHVYLLKSLLEEAGIEDVNLIVGETNADRAYTESLIKAIEKRKVRCVIATVAAIKLGANIKALDCLHWAMPVANKKDIEQLLGRIRRRVEDKKFCTAVYYLDQRVPYLVNLFKRKAIPVFRKLHINRFKKMLAI